MFGDVRARILGALRGKRDVVADGAAGLTIEVASIVGALVSFTLLGRQLGPTDYGALVAMYAVIGIAVCLAFVGPGLAMVHIGMREGLSTVAGHFFGEQLAFSILAGLAVLLLSPVVVPALPLTTLVPFVLAEFVGIGLMVTSWNMRMVAAGYRTTLRLQLIPQAVKLGVIVTLAIADRLTLQTYGVTFMLCMVPLGFAVFMRTTRSLGVARRPRPLRAEHVSTTLSMSSTMWAWSLHNDGDKLTMSAYGLGPDVGLYAAAYKLVQFGGIPVNALATSTFRSFVDPTVAGQVKRAVRYSLAVSLYTATAALAIIVLAPVAIPILVGEGFSDSVVMARWLAPLLVIRGALTFPANALVGLGHTHARLVAYMVSAGVGMALYVWLIPTMSWRGAVIGSYVSDLVLLVSLWVLLARSHRRQPIAAAGHVEPGSDEAATAVERQDEHVQQ
jgi:O-antigen/teichoic acid export membrane protein